MKNAAKQRIVMIDDEEDFQSLVHVWLSPKYEHIALLSGERLAEDLERSRPSLVILDVHMPGADGFTLCRRIRDNRRFSDLPILFLTGSKSDKDFLRNIKAGAMGYLTKPIGRKQLLSAIHDLLPDPVEFETTGTGD